MSSPSQVVAAALLLPLLHLACWVDCCSLPPAPLSANYSMTLVSSNHDVVFGRADGNMSIFASLTVSSLTLDGSQALVALLQPVTSHFSIIFSSREAELGLPQLAVYQQSSNSQWVALGGFAQHIADNISSNTTWMANFTVAPLAIVDRTQPSTLSMTILPFSFCPLGSVPPLTLHILIPSNGLKVPQYAIRVAQGLASAATVATFASFTGAAISTAARLRAQRDCMIAFDDSTLPAIGITFGIDRGSTLRGAIMTNVVVVLVVLLIFGVILPVSLAARCCRRVSFLECFLVRLRYCSMPGVLHAPMTFLITPIASASTSLVANPQDSPADVLGGVFGYFVCVCHVGTCGYYWWRSGTIASAKAAADAPQRDLGPNTACGGGGSSSSSPIWPRENAAALREVHYAWFPMAETMMLLIVGIIDGIKPASYDNSLCIGKTAACLGVIVAYFFVLVVTRPAHLMLANASSIVLLALVIAVGSIVLHISNEGLSFQGQRERDAVDMVTLAVLIAAFAESLRQGIPLVGSAVAAARIVLFSKTCEALEESEMVPVDNAVTNRKFEQRDLSSISFSAIPMLESGFFDDSVAEPEPFSEEMAQLAGTLRRRRSSMSPPRLFARDAVDDMLATTTSK